MSLQLAAGQFESANSTLGAHSRALEKSEMGRPASELTSLLRSAPVTLTLEREVVPAVVAQAHLPRYFDSFFGRSQERQLIGQLVVGERGPSLITLVGPGGVGKTRLSVEVGDDLADQVSSILYYSLETLTGPVILDQVNKAIDGSPTLVILDNAETNLPEARNLVQKLRLADPRIRIVVTSRQLLRISGEQVVPIEPLPLPIYALSVEELSKNESVRLFENRVQSIDPNFRIEPGNAAEVVRLLTQLDGLPLASEIAACGVATMGIRSVSRQIDSRVTELVSSRIDVPDRHRSLRAAIEWSYEELSDRQKAVLRRIATLHDGGSEALIHHLVGPENAEIVPQLCDRSLLRRVASSSGLRFRLLESIRVFADGQNGAEEAASLQKAHARAVLNWVLETFPRKGSFTELQWQQLEDEHENIRAAILWGQHHDGELALQLADKIWPFWTMRGSLRVGRETLRGLLATKELVRSPLLASVTHAFSAVLYTGGRFQECSDELDALEALASELNEQFLLLTSRAMHGVVAMDLADYGLAYRLAKASWHGYSSLPGYEMDALISRATMARNAAFMGRAEEAIAEMEAVFAERIARAIPFETARGYRELAEVYRETGKDPYPIALQEKSLTLYRELTARPWLIACLLDLHGSYIGVGRFDDAIALESELEALVEKTDTRLMVADIRLAQANRHRCMKNVPEAKALLTETLEIAVAESYVPLLLIASLMAAQVLQAAGNLENARTLAIQVRAIQGTGNGGLMASYVRELDVLETSLNLPMGDSDPVTAKALGAKALSFMIG